MPGTDIRGMTAVTAETLHERPRLRVVESPPAEQVEAWELHSELALVCPEVRKCALERLPLRDPDAVLRPARTIEPTNPPANQPSAPALPRSAAIYALHRLLQTTRTALFMVAALVVLASVAELTH
jgi:hypothetical protein